VNHSGCIFSSTIAICADAEAFAVQIETKIFVGDSPILHQFHLVVFPHLACLLHVFLVFGMEAVFKTFSCICKMLECLKQMNRKYFHLDL
jgi:hypothetical protein